MRRRCVGGCSLYPTNPRSRYASASSTYVALFGCTHDDAVRRHLVRADPSSRCTGRPGGLAGDVPQRDVDVALHGRVEHPGPRAELVPDRADVERVAPDEQLLRGAEELWRDVDARPGDEDVAVDALVGRDRDDVDPRGRRPHAGRHGSLVLEHTDVSDLHGGDEIRCARRLLSARRQRPTGAPRSAGAAARARGS